MTTHHLILLTAAVALHVAAGAHASAKDDVVSFDQGNRLVGEIKYLERGKLYFKTPATDTISIEWTHVDVVVSKQRMRLELSGGKFYFGYLGEGSEAGQVAVKARTWEGEMRLNEIVGITPLEDTWLDRLDLNVGFGFNYTKSSEIRQTNLNLKARYETERRWYDLSASLTESTDSSEENNRRVDVIAQGFALRPDNRFVGIVGQLERNDAQEIDLRAGLNYGWGRFLKRTNSNTLLVFGGFGVSREIVDSEGDDNETNLQALGSIQWNVFRYDDPELDLTTSLTAFPILTDWGRVLSQLNVTLTWELYQDIDWQLSVYGTHDSRPVAADVDKQDYGVVTGISIDF
jgi:hypothetical protein